MVRNNDVYSGLGTATTAVGDAATSNDPNEEVLEAEVKSEDATKKDESKLPTVEEVDDAEEEETVEQPDDSTKAKLETVHVSEELEATVAHAIETAEHVYQHLDRVKVFPLTGSFSQALAKQKYRHFFHGAFVSSRFAQVVDDALLQEILSVDGINPVVAVETAKFLVSIKTDVKRDFVAKIEEYAGKKNWRKLPEPPVYRRHRDEDDKEDDVVFFQA